MGTRITPRRRKGPVVRGNVAPPIIGDVNNDGLISMVDLYFIVSFLMGEIEFDDNELIIADVNFDLSVDIYDVLMISNFLMDS